jgi:hypothetical protein
MRTGKVTKIVPSREAQNRRSPARSQQLFCDSAGRQKYGPQGHKYCTVDLAAAHQPFSFLSLRQRSSDFARITGRSGYCTALRHGRPMRLFRKTAKNAPVSRTNSVTFRADPPWPEQFL